MVLELRCASDKWVVGGQRRIISLVRWGRNARHRHNVGDIGELCVGVHVEKHRLRVRSRGKDDRVRGSGEKEPGIGLYNGFWAAREVRENRTSFLPNHAGGSSALHQNSEVTEYQSSMTAHKVQWIRGAENEPQRSPKRGSNEVWETARSTYSTP